MEHGSFSDIAKRRRVSLEQYVEGRLKSLVMLFDGVIRELTTPSAPARYPNLIERNAPVRTDPKVAVGVLTALSSHIGHQSSLLQHLTAQAPPSSSDVGPGLATHSRPIVSSPPSAAAPPARPASHVLLNSTTSVGQPGAGVLFSWLTPSRIVSLLGELHPNDTLRSFLTPQYILFFIFPVSVYFDRSCRDTMRYHDNGSQEGSGDKRLKRSKAVSPLSPFDPYPSILT
jgi:hypothetical protein